MGCGVRAGGGGDEVLQSAPYYFNFLLFVLTTQNVLKTQVVSDRCLQHIEYLHLKLEIH